MAGLMSEYLAAPPEYEHLGIPPLRDRFAIKRRMITGETVNSDALPERGLAENKVPRRLGIKVFHRDCQQAKRVRRHAGFEKIQHIAGEDLAIAGLRITTRGDPGWVERYRRQQFDFHGEKRRRKLAQLFD